MIENANRYADLLREATHVHVTDEFGTDVEFDVTGRPVLVNPGITDEPGQIDFYPGAQVSNAPIEETINGLIVTDGSITSEGVLDQPVEITMENGVITAIEGGAQAESWKHWLDSTGDPKIYQLCHFSVGFNPKARITGNMMEDERLSGGIDFGFGSQNPGFQGTVGTGKWHTDIMLTAASIHFDGTLITDKTRFNADLGFRKL
jgi:leucyl aminopeptidase (aminopeptidase T)